MSYKMVHFYKLKYFKLFKELKKRFPYLDTETSIGTDFYSIIVEYIFFLNLILISFKTFCNC